MPLLNTEIAHTLNLNGQMIDLSSPIVMSIVNITPDSFYAESRQLNRGKEALIKRIRADIEAGASIVDIGGYSSRPGAQEVSLLEEIIRVKVALEAVRDAACGYFPVSIDTFRSKVVDEVLKHYGPCIVNDITAGEGDKRMLNVVAKNKLPFIMMHMKGTPETMQQMTNYDNLVRDVLRYLSSRINKARAIGVQDIIVDPGFGFAKTTEQNFELLSALDSFKVLDLPILAGLSRKSMIYNTLETQPFAALNGTTALNWEALSKGANILRVHDVKEAMEVVTLYKKYKACSRKI